ncbi:Nudix family hydrolase [Xanthomonas theicola]|uniref:8-oxo-dGTP diphosphatase n=1 Tax=Xanthomonas theicola TaxID=56464 RepID=A0A2S6ZB12_9XANT|nr:Nudix family hydrolase [Xanthomonas theicola]PPT81435.1 DNA mismatch repair protein MutT [Xanthomonas theicola]QNH25598.1 Nudix family hydrolase [Xanthomonas theicola]
MFEPLRSIHVVAGVITDARGRILLARRTDGRDLAGLWEFPGGKREAGETSEQALVRELHEELGIKALVGAALMEVPQRYPDKRLRLEMRQVLAWKGAARGREGQALTWVTPDKLDRYAMPPADQPVVAMLRQPDRYLVTPEPTDADRWLAALEQALQGGVQRVQLRARSLPAQRWQPLARAAAALCAARGAQVLVNRDLALAQELGVGVHLQSEQLLQFEARPLPAGQCVAASCHTLEELQAAQRLGCDFAVVGPLAATASHPGAAALGWDAFERLREEVALPLYPIGGLSPDQVAEARRHGGQGIAAICGLWPVEVDAA